MNNKTPIIFSIILLSLLIFILVMFLVVNLTGGKGRIINTGSKSDKIIYDKTFSLEEIKNIEIKQDAGDVTFKETSNDNITVTVYGEEASDIEVNLNENKLMLDYTRRNKFIFFNIGNIKNDIIIYIPVKYNNTIKINNNLGNCYINNLPNATINVNCDAGNVEAGKIKNANIKCDLGNIKVEEILNRCDIKVDSGNVEIEKLLINENSKIKADLGNINIKETNDIYIDAEVDLGKANISTNNRNSEVTLKLECDCGNINVGNK